VNRRDRAIRVLTTLAVLVVAGIAAMISFTHIDHLAITHGQTVLSAALLPLSIDGTVAASSLVMLRAARLDLDTPKLARVMLALAVLATLACNVLFGAGFGIVGTLLSGWPAVAFIGCAELAIGMIRRARSVAPVAEAIDLVPETVARAVSAGVSGPVADDVPDAAVTPQARSAARTVARKRTRRHTPPAACRARLRGPHRERQPAIAPHPGPRDTRPITSASASTWRGFRPGGTIRFSSLSCSAE
jgi:Protein of unknown function (DUF2637)